MFGNAHVGKTHIQRSLIQEAFNRTHLRGQMYQRKRSRGETPRCRNRTDLLWIMDIWGTPDVLGWIVPPKNSSFSELYNVTLFGNRIPTIHWVVTEVFLKKGHQCQVRIEGCCRYNQLRWGQTGVGELLIQNDWCLYKKRKHRETQRRTTYENRGRDQSLGVIEWQR